MASDVKKVVLAYSGGLDTSIILKWLQEIYGCEVVTFTADLGQGEELAPARKKAEMLGIKEIFVEDLREAFVRDFVFPMFRANALYEGVYLLGTSIARPLIAKRQIEIARETGADAVAHGATGKGNDQVRFELTYAALAPQLTVIAPWREWELDSRTALLDFARRHDIPVPVTAERPYSTDRNLFHVSYEGGILEDPWAEPPDKMFLLTQSPEAAPDVAVAVEVEFEDGDPVAVDGARLGPVRLLERLNRLGGEHGVGDDPDALRKRFDADVNALSGPIRLDTVCLNCHKPGREGPHSGFFEPTDQAAREYGENLAEALRKALHMALDFDEINDTFYNNINIIYDGPVPPPLDGFRKRAMIAGRLPNTGDNLTRFVLDPQGVSPGIAMPKSFAAASPASTTISPSIRAFLQGSASRAEVSCLPKRFDQSSPPRVVSLAIPCEIRAWTR